MPLWLYWYLPSLQTYGYYTESAAQPLQIMPNSSCHFTVNQKCVKCRLSKSKFLLRGKTCLHLQKVPLWLSRLLPLLFTCTFWQYTQKSAAMTLQTFVFTFYLYILTIYSEKCRYDSTDFCLYFLLIHFNMRIKKVPLWLSGFPRWLFTGTF